ncbi:MAG: molecular chaperone HtpG, partial [Candidatus Lokiarchaeota archaeon]|nr:molecular chaperone HtpG [Candidatus Lokiarchaeota archaeon]
VILYLNDEETEFLEQHRLESIIKKYSNFVSFPIYVSEEGVEEEEPETQEVDLSEDESEAETSEEKGEGEEEEAEEEEERKPVNQTEPIWKRNPSDVTEEEYKSFYKYISKRYDDYSEVIHYNVDGRVQFRSITYIPETKTKDILQPEIDYGPALYSKNVLIMNHCKELVPQWMRFTKGVVDSQDIPLNVSRDTIQNNRIIMKMESLITKKFIRELKNISKSDKEKYEKFWKEYGFFIKEGIIADRGRRDRLLKLLRFKTSKTENDELIGLEDYLKRMKEDQDEIFYLVGENINTLRMSPHLGYYKQNDLEVILFDEPVDNFLMMNVPFYTKKIEEDGEEKDKNYNFKPIDETEAKKKDEEGEDSEDEEEDEKKEEEMPEDVKAFLNKVKDILGEKIIDAQISDKLYGNTCRLANPAGGMTSTMQRAMRYWTLGTGQDQFRIPQKILEFNPKHPTVKSLIETVSNNPESRKIKPVIMQLFENCLLAEGDLPDPSLMVPRMNQLIEMLMTGNDDVENPLEKEREQEKEKTIEEEDSEEEAEESKESNNGD